jgi:uncharacterized OB-fold protein
MRKAIFGLFGSKCKKCDTVQFPPQRICVNPDCGKLDEMEDFRLSDKTAKILSFTADNLIVSSDPPSLSATLEFETGGKYQFDMTGCDFAELYVGMPVEMVFRRRLYDPKRDISTYFWKGIPKRR